MVMRCPMPHPFVHLPRPVWSQGCCWRGSWPRGPRRSTPSSSGVPPLPPRLRRARPIPTEPPPPTRWDQGPGDTPGWGGGSLPGNGSGLDALWIQLGQGFRLIRTAKNIGGKRKRGKTPQAQIAEKLRHSTRIRFRGHQKSKIQGRMKSENAIFF